MEHKEYKEKIWAVIGSVVSVRDEFISEPLAKDRDKVYEEVWLVGISSNRDDMKEMYEKLDHNLKYINTTRISNSTSIDMINNNLEKLWVLKEAINDMEKLDPKLRVESRYDKIKYYLVSKEA